MFTARNFSLSREGQVTDRYTKAITQLGDEKLDVRIGGIYAMERVARDSARDHPTVMEVLSAFIREHSREPWPAPDPNLGGQERATRPDVRAALTVIGRRDARRDIQTIDLSGADLAGANLADALLIGANLARANLTGVNPARAHVGGAHLIGANLAYADLASADLAGAHLAGANLTGADLTGADLTDAHLGGATLINAVLADARWPSDYALPEGWQRDTDSGRLKRVATHSDGATTN